MEKSTAIFGSLAILMIIAIVLFASPKKPADSKKFISEKRAEIKETASFNVEEIERLLKLVFSGITAISLLTIAIILFGVCVHYVEYPYSSDKKVRFYLGTDVPVTISIDKIDYIGEIGRIRGNIDADVAIKN